MSDLMQPLASASGDTYDLAAKYEREHGSIYLTGVQALVRVPIDQMRADRRAGLDTRTFVSGYPGSPLAGYDMELQGQAKLLDQWGIVHRPGLNEELAATSVMGSQIAQNFGPLNADGVLGIWYGKAPGLDRATDAVRHGNFYGTTHRSGTLVLVGDDPAAKSSSVPSGSEGVMADLHLPVLYPGNVQEVLDLGRHGVEMSRASGLWVGVKTVTPVADGAGTAFVAPDRIQPVRPEYLVDGEPFVVTTPSSLSPLRLMETEQQILDVRLQVALEYGRVNRLNAITHRTGDDWFGIAAAGHLYYEVLEALRKLGLDDDDLARRGIRLLRLGMLHPFDDATVQDFAEGLDEILVVEEKRPFLELLVRNALYGHAPAPRVVGRRGPDGRTLVPGHGAVTADTVTDALVDRLTQRIDPGDLARPRPERAALPMMMPRTPYFCSGCPHNTSLKVPDDSVVGAGIGCHSMVSFLDPEVAGEIRGVTQMGGEGAQWIGAAPFVDTPHMFQNMGEGTFFHSGEMAIRAAVAADVHMTYKILYNRAVAMTGGQEAQGALEVAEMARLLETVGVSRIIVTAEDRSRYRKVQLPRIAELRDREQIIDAQEELRATPGVTVLIHDQQCAAEARRLRKRGKQPDPPERVVISERVCEGCGDCGVKSNCLSVQPIDTEFGQKTTIHQSSCNKDYSCLKGDCPSFLTVEPRRTRSAAVQKAIDWFRRAGDEGPDTGKRPRRPSDIAVPPLPDPVPIVSSDDFSVRMPGIGGTGVVTVAQVLGTAALLDGRYVSGLDQTGLAQKGGAVVSDLRISTRPIETGNQISAGRIDLFLVFDLLVALSPKNAIGADSERTVAVVSTTPTPTGQMIGRPDRHLPPTETLVDEIAGLTRRVDNRYLDMAHLAERLFGRTTTANVLGLGVAYQVGALPVAAERIEQALELNGVAVAANIAAFRIGRWWAHDREAVEQLANSMSATTRGPSRRSTPDGALAGDLIERLAPGSELNRLLAVRVPDLVDYQDRAYAERYLATVAAALEAERAHDADSTAFTEAVATYLHKLMAYKDEYEVPRLLLAERTQAQVDELAAGEPVKVSYNLHPPLLRAMGMDRKIRMGPWATPVLKGLRSMKRVRGTALDLFGRAHVRKLERALITEYETVIGEVTARLPEIGLARAVEIASLPDMVRGYEGVKEASVERYRERLAELLPRDLATQGMTA